MGKPEELFKEMCSYFDSEGIKYLVLNEEDNLVRLLFSGRSWKRRAGRAGRLRHRALRLDRHRQVLR